MWKLKKFLKRENGQSMVELALTLPVLLMLLCGILDFGWIFSNKLATTYSCREGARYGVIYAGATDLNTLIVDKVKASSPEYAKDSLIITTLLTVPSDPESGDVTVKVLYKFKVLTPFASVFINSQEYTVSAQCTMKAE